MDKKNLCRSKNDRMITGVCGGVAEYFNLDPALVRIGTVILCFVTSFVAALVYCAAAFIMPEADDVHDDVVDL